MPLLLFIRSILALAVAGVLALLASAGIDVPVQNPPTEIQELTEIVVENTEEPALEVEPEDDPREEATPDLPSEVTTTPAPPPSTEVAPEPPPVEPEVLEPLPITDIPEKLSFNIIDAKTRSTVVNLICTSKDGRTIRATSGSGVVIDGRGVVLTNAHVAQFWLLPRENPLGTTECTLRTTVPIAQTYHATLLYLPPLWIKEHAKDITKETSTGTGEHDYALLLITDTTDGSPLPAVFPAATVDVSEKLVDAGDSVVIAAYPARQQVTSLELFDALQLSSVRATVEEVFTFEKTTLDLFSVGGNILSFQGSSGGPVVNDDNVVVGIVSTSTDGESFLDRNLRAITLAHINRSLKDQTGLDLEFWLASDLEAKAALFTNSTATELGEKLVSELED